MALFVDLIAAKTLTLIIFILELLLRGFKIIILYLHSENLSSKLDEM